MRGAEMDYASLVLSREDRARQLDALLAPFAVLHGGGLGREQTEEEDSVRLRFQRDRGRIIHTQEFRRLKGKTQVFVGGGGDHFRTRLTHTMEVAGISRDIARGLRLNEDLAECIALAHDLGHPPFGHAGEEALHEWMVEHGAHFEHNEQSHRIVTLLAEHSSLYKGLNVNREILEGLLKHSTPHDRPKGAGKPRAPSLEAQVVNSADEIAYTAHDCEDGLLAGLFSLEEILSVPLAKRAHDRTLGRGTSLRGAIIDSLVTDLYSATTEVLSLHRVTTLDDVYNTSSPLVMFSENMQASLGELRAFLWKHMYNNPTVLRRSSVGQQIIRGLCMAYSATPNPKVNALHTRIGGALYEAIKDYIAGMTDAYAFLQASIAGVLPEGAEDALGHY